MSKNDIIERINALPSNNTEPAVLIAVVSILKALAVVIADEADVVSSPALTVQDRAEQDATIAHQQAPKLPLGHLSYIPPSGSPTPLPAVATARYAQANTVAILYSSDGGMTYTTMVSSVVLAESQALAQPGEAFVPGT